MRWTPLADPDGRFRAALPDALRLVGIVHGDGGSVEVAELLAGADVPALCVVLAALVDDERTPAELLAWANPPARPAAHAAYSTPVLREAHARYVRGLRDQPTVDGEREYQRRRKQAHRHPAA